MLPVHLIQQNSSSLMRVHAQHRVSSPSTSTWQPESWRVYAVDPRARTPSASALVRPFLSVLVHHIHGNCSHKAESSL